MSYLLKGATATGAGDSLQNHGATRTFQAIVTGTGALTADVVIEVSNDDATFIQLGTMALSGTDNASDGFASDAPWFFVRANVTSISGTGAAVDVIMGA